MKPRRRIWTSTVRTSSPTLPDERSFRMPWLVKMALLTSYRNHERVVVPGVPTQPVNAAFAEAPVGSVMVDPVEYGDDGLPKRQ